MRTKFNSILNLTDGYMIASEVLMLEVFVLQCS